MPEFDREWPEVSRSYWHMDGTASCRAAERLSSVATQGSSRVEVMIGSSPHPWSRLA